MGRHRAVCHGKEKGFGMIAVGVNQVGSINADSLVGSAFDDTLSGWTGNDTLDASDGNDLLYGGEGDDSLLSGLGDDTVSGGNGNDWLINGGGNDLIYGGGGHDTIVMGDAVAGSFGTAYGGLGNDNFLVTQTSSAQISGGAGIDLLSLQWVREGAISLNLGTAFATAASGAILAFSGIERLTLQAGDAADTITGGNFADDIAVAAGANTVSAGGGADIVRYTTGAANTLDGGLGNDLLQVQAGPAALNFTVNTLTGAADDAVGSSLTGFERFDLVGGTLADYASLGLGNDTFHGGIGRDTVLGDAGNDDLDGGGQGDALFGGAGNDHLDGGRGADSLDGSDGSDVVNGSLGSDILTGGAGADYFVFGYTEDGIDLITDFSSGEDVLRVAAPLLGAAAPGPGFLSPAYFNLGTASGTTAQFVLTYDASLDQSALHWQASGSDPIGGDLVLMTFTGQVTLTAADISLFL